MRSMVSGLVRFALFAVLGASATAQGVLLVGGWNSNNVIAYDATTGAVIGPFVSAGSGNLTNPHDLIYGPDGNLYVASTGNNRVLRYDGETGAFIDTFVTAGAGGLNAPTGLLFGPDGNLYVSSFNDRSILRYDGTTRSLH